MSHPSKPTLTVYRRTACELCDDADLMLQAVLEERIVRGDLVPTIRRVAIDGQADLEARYGADVPVFDLDGSELRLVTSRRQIGAFLDRLMPRVA
jgi:hypothetical protein